MLHPGDSDLFDSALRDPVHSPALHGVLVCGRLPGGDGVARVADGEAEGVALNAPDAAGMGDIWEIDDFEIDLGVGDGGGEK